MKGLFNNADAFKEDISRWDVSQVQSMKGMFSMASAFDADITSWDTISLVSSEMMFQGATTWHTKYQRKDGKEAIMGAMVCSSGEGVPLPGDFSCFSGPPSAWIMRDQPPLPPSPPHLESPPPPARAVSSPPPPPGSVPEVPPPPAPAYDPPTTSVGVGTVVLVAFIMLVIGFVSGYLVRLLRSNQGVPILDEEPEEEIFERAGYTSS
jgi:surface protein